MGQVHAFGLAPLAYFNSMLDQTYQPEYSLCERQGLFLKRPDGSTYTFIYKVRALGAKPCSRWGGGPLRPAAA